MKTYYLWATLLSVSAGRVLIADLVNRGYAVKGAAESGRSHTDGEASTLYALAIEVKNEVAGATLMTQITEHLRGNEAMWHSLVLVCPPGDIRWQASNIVLPKKEEPKPAVPADPAPASRFDRLNEPSSEGAKG